MLLALIIAAMVTLYSLGYLTACVVNAPLLREGERVPEHPQVEEPRHLSVVRAGSAFPFPAPGPASNSGRVSTFAEKESAKPTLYDWQRDAEALGWLEGA